MQPVLFESTIFVIYSLWFFFTLGFAIASYIFYKLIQTNRLDLGFVTRNAVHFLVGTLVSSRVFAIIGNPEYFFRLNEEGHWQILKSFWNLITIWDKELSFWGAIIGFLFIFIQRAKAEHQNFAKWCDVLTISLISGISVGNIGTFLDGVNYGKPTDLFWGITFQSSFIKYAVPIHPTQLYAFLYTAFIGIFLYFLFKRYRNQYDGLVTYTGFFLFSLCRFLEEFVRGDDVTTIFGIRLPLIAFLISTILFGTLMRKYQKHYHIPIFSLITNHPFIHTVRNQVSENYNKIRVKGKTK